MKNSHGITSLIPLFAAALLQAGATAQDSLAGSEQYIAVASVTPTGADTMESTKFAAHAVLGLPFLGGVFESAGYSLVAGVATTPQQLAAGGPLVFGTSPALNVAGAVPPGGTARVFGYQLADGSGTAAAWFGGAPAPSLTVVSNTVLQAQLPPGTNAFENPLGASSVAVTNGLGSATSTDAIVFTPALLEQCPARVGEVLELRLHHVPGALYQVVLGGSIPGFAVPIPPLAGALELVNNPIALTPFLISPEGLDLVPIPIPDQPNLIGVSLQLQGVVLEGFAPLQGSFTNRLVATIGP